MGNISAYIYYYKKFHNLVDSIEQQDQAIQIAKAEKIFVEEDMNRQKGLLIFIIVGVFFIGILAVCLICYYHRKNIRNKNEQLQKYEMAEQKTQTQIHALLDNIQKIGETCKREFMKSPEYQTLKDKVKEQKVLSYQDQQKYSVLLKESFCSYIQSLSGIVNLSSTDCFFCCLFFLRFNVSECAYIRAISEKGVRTQKSRLMQRVKEVFGNDITFETFFNLPQKGLKSENK